MATELKGIETALEHCMYNPVAREKINIFADSLSALQALQKVPPADNIHIINQIIMLIQALKIMISTSTGSHPMPVYIIIISQTVLPV